MSKQQSSLEHAALIFERACKLQGEAREAYLEGACDGNGELRAEIESMIAAHQRQGEFLASPTQPDVPFPDTRTAKSHKPAEGPGTIIGNYKLLQEIGHGGFGVVYMAEQEQPVRRKVALKIIKLGMDTKQVIARFEAERQALAMMDHPNIAKVFDAGATDTGRPYFVMELVRGVPVTEYCDTENLNTHSRLELFMQICHAVQHAHTKGIIHRDIKPSNVMITLHDGAPVPKVIDFGIAKAIHQRLTDKTLFTEYKQFMGTPEYMSPEQAEMSGLDIDTRSDIYSLGVLLYELLTGTTPFDGRRLRSAGIEELQRIIREEEPDKPSTRLSSLQSLSRSSGSDPSETRPLGSGLLESAAPALRERSPRAIKAPSSMDPLPLPHGRGSDSSSILDIARHRRTDPRSLAKQLRGDLDWVVMKCLEKERARRYETANGLAADLQRHLSDEPVEASPPSASYRFRKFARRNKRLLGSITGIVAALIIGLTLATYGFITASNERDEKEAARAAESEQRALAEANARRATDEATRAGKAEADAAQRAAELEQVAEFQSSQLSEIDVELMGTRLRRAILEQRRALLAGRGADEASNEPGLNELEQSLAGVNFTNIALDALDENVFERALDAIEKDFTDQPLVKARLYQTIADTLRDLGLLDRAAQPQQEALRIRRETLGDDHPDTLQSINNLGGLLKSMGKLEEAESYYREALEARHRVRGDDHPDTLQSISNIGVLLLSMGKLEEAESYLREALEGRRRVLGDEHPETLSSIINMGALLHAQGKLPQAQSYYREALEKSRRVLGDDHPSTLLSINNMGALLVSMGKLAEVESYYREALEKYRRVLGDDHPDTLRSIRNMGLQLQLMGKHEEAETYHREALEAYHRVLGDDHPDTLSSLDTLAALYKQQGRYDAAESLHAQVLDIRERVLGREHPSTLDSMNNLAVLYALEGRYDEAEPLYDRTFEIRRRVLGEEHPRTLNSMCNLAGLYTKQGRYDEAESLLTQTSERSQHLLGREHPDTVRSMGLLAIVYIRQGRYDAAQPLFTEALNINRRTLGEEHPRTLQSLNDLAACYMDRGWPSEAEPLLEQVVALLKRVLGEEHPQTLGSMNNLALLYEQLGRHDEAEALFLETLELQKRLLGKEHPDTLMSMNNLAILWKMQGRYDEAERLYLETWETEKRVLGEEHPDTLVSMNNLAVLYEDQGRYAEAERLHTDTLDIRKRVLGDEHPHTLRSSGNLLSVLLAQGKIDEARPLAAEQLERFRSAAEQPEANPEGLNNYAWMLLTIEPADLRDSDAALELARRANNLTDLDNALYLDTLALAYHMTGDTARALETQEEALSLLTEDQESNRPEMEANLAKYKAALEQGAEDDR